MLRFWTIALASAVLLAYAPSRLPQWQLLPLSDDQYGYALTGLKCILAFNLLLELNSLLNLWAENRWMWSSDKSVWEWKKEVAVVTGGSNGIGALVVRRLVSYGIRVAVLDVEPLSDALQHDEGNLVRYYCCDITSRDAVHHAGEAIRSDLGAPSILVNNAGIGNANNILDVTQERLRTMFDVNIISHWNTVQEFLPDMIAKKKGHIMSTASLAAFLGLAGSVEYSCTKAGLIAFHEGLTQELKHRYKAPQIKTTIVYPNWTRTRMITSIENGIKAAFAPIVEPDVVAKAMVEQIIAARSGQVILGPRLTASIRAMPIWLQEVIRDRVANIVTGDGTTAVT